VIDPAEHINLAATVAAAASKLGDKATAEKYVAEINSFAARISDVQERIFELASAASSLGSRGLAAEARKCCDAAVKLARGLPDPNDKVRELLGIHSVVVDGLDDLTLDELVKEIDVAGKSVTEEEVRDDLKYLRDPESRTRSLVKQAGERRERKDLAGAIASAEKARLAAAKEDNPWMRTQIQVLVGEEFAALGRNDLARDVAREARLSAAEIDRLDFRIDQEAGIARLLWRIGEHGEARQVLTQIAANVNHIDDPSERIRSLATIAVAAAALGEKPTLERSLADIDTVTPKIVDLSQRIGWLAAAAAELYRGDLKAEAKKRVDIALAIARGIPDPELKAERLATVLDTIYEYSGRRFYDTLLAEIESEAEKVPDPARRAKLMEKIHWSRPYVPTSD
jgi:hypothetical protein